MAPEPTALPEPEPTWSPWRWLIYIGIAFGIHLGLIYALANRQPISRRPVKNDIRINMTLARNEYLELQDPTVFAGPHPHGFAASTWLKLPEIPFPTNRWNEPPRFWKLTTETLGASFLNQMPVNPTAPPNFSLMSPPPTTILPPLPPLPVPSESSLRLAGNLAGWKLVAAPASLPLQRTRDNLTNSIVQVLVDETGSAFSATLIPPGSSLPEADQLALSTAARLKFSPPVRPSGVTVGTVIFEWQPAPSTNSPPNE